MADFYDGELFTGELCEAGARIPNTSYKSL